MTLDDILAANSLPTDRASLMRIIRALARETLRLRGEVEQLNKRLSRGEG